MVGWRGAHRKSGIYEVLKGPDTVSARYFLDEWIKEAFFAAWLAESSPGWELAVVFFPLLHVRMYGFSRGPAHGGHSAKSQGNYRAWS